MSKSGPSPRSAYNDFQTLQTRWEDNDAYGHMNNIVHYSLIDTAVTNWQRDRSFFDVEDVKFRWSKADAPISLRHDILIRFMQA